MNISNRNELESLVAGALMSLGVILGGVGLGYPPLILANAVLFIVASYIIISTTSKLNKVFCFLLGSLPTGTCFYFLHEFVGDTYLKISAVVVAAALTYFIADRLAKMS